MSRLERLLNPRAVALFGGAWAGNVLTQLQKSGYSGEIWPVHPSRTDIQGLACYADIKDLPRAPDAAFLGINRNLTIEIIDRLSAMGAGGAICFASGFEESGNDHLKEALIEAAGDMPFLGPNCYGLLNYLDNVILWPDQHGGLSVERGVGILAQSSNIAINMSMQKRGLPIGQIITIGNQASISIADLIQAQIDDPRISAIGLYLEGFGDIAAFEEVCHRAHRVGKPIVALKAGRSQKARISAMSHTASLVGSAAESSTLLKRLGIAEVRSVSVFLETLKVLHAYGPLTANSLASVSCSGGEASLMADLVDDLDLEFPDFPKASLDALKSVLGDDVILANPLDYHTYIWGDVAKMTACFTAVIEAGNCLNVFVLDLPRSDRCDPQSYDCAVQAILNAAKVTQAQIAVLALMPENLDEKIIQRFRQGGVTVLNGMETGLKAIEAAYKCAHQSNADPLKTRLAANVWLAQTKMEDVGRKDIILNEYEAKQALAKCGLEIPASQFCAKKTDILKAVKSLQYPLVLKTLGLAHKTEAGGVILNIQDKTELQSAIERIADTGQGFLLEQMSEKPIMELIIGVTREKTGLLLLTIGAGGIFTELIKDSVSVLLPCSRSELEAAIMRLKAAPLLKGYRGQVGVDMEAVYSAIKAVTEYVKAHKNKLIEMDINPLMVGPEKVIAVDAFIRLGKT